MSTNQYNLYNSEALFKQFLLAENISLVTIKNYLSDFRYFTGWTTSFVKNSSFDLLTIDLLNEYKAYLVKNNFPLKTINRRLSTIRKYCSFCISQGWLKENPAKKILNIILLKKKNYSNILNQFQSYLVSINTETNTITNCLDDVQELLSIS